MHYQRLTKSGYLEQPLSTGPDETRFWAKVNKNGPIPEHRPELGPCWLWTAGICTNTGYGNIWWLGRTQSAHRIAWGLLVGRVPVTLTIDHLCFIRHCVNPKHMETVTQAENNRRTIVTAETRRLRSEAGRKGGYARTVSLRASAEASLRSP